MPVLNITILACAMIYGASAIASDCVSSVAKILENASPAEKKAIKAAGAQTLTAPQKELVNKIVESLKNEPYTASSIMAQEKELKKAGITKEQLVALHREGVIPNSAVSFANGSPNGVELLTANVQRMNQKSLKDLRNNEKLNYIFGEDGHLYVSKEPLEIDPQKITFATNSELVNGNPASTVIRESGELLYDKSTKNFVFHPKSGLDTSAQQVREMIKEAHAISPDLKLAYQKSRTIPESRVLKCLDIVSAQTSGKNFVLDRLITDNIVTTGAIVGSELAGAGRMQTDQGRKVIMSDVVGGNINNFIGSSIGKRLITKDSGFVKSMAARTATGFGLIEVQKQVTKVFVGDSNKQTANDIANFNRAFFVARLPMNHYFDQFMVKTLPNLIFDSCQKHPAMSVLVSPKTVRLGERYGSSVLYYGLRSAVVGN